MIKTLGTIIGTITLLITLVFITNIAGLTNYKFFAPKYENARREVFENTKSYRDGTKRDFDNLYVAYQTAKETEEKTAILSVIRERVSGTPNELIPSNINQLLTKGN